MDPGVDPDVAEELQAQLDAVNEQDPPDIDSPYFSANIRHACTRARQAKINGRAVSTAIQLREEYIEHDDGEHALVYREGMCVRCKSVARSCQGRAVLVAERPPIYGRVARA